MASEGLSFAALLMSSCPSSLAPSQVSRAQDRGKGFVTNIRIIKSLVTASFCCLPRVAGTHVFFRVARGGWLDSLYNSA